MAKFKDSSGKEYTLRLTFGVWRQIKDGTGVDIAADFEKVYVRLHTELDVFANVLFHFCKGCNQFEGDEAAFAEILDGETLEAAREAVVAAVIDFFPNRQKTAATTMIQKARVLEDAIGTKAMLVMDETLTKTMRGVKDSSSESFGPLLASLASTTRNDEPFAKSA
jgi:hypothetical protein